MVIQARNNPLAELFWPLRRKSMLRITDYLDADLVLFLTQDNRDDAIDAMIHRLDVNGKLVDKESFRDAIFHREELVSTGIGMGVAVPHAKMKEIRQFFIAIGVQQTKGIDWNSIDKVPVRVVFMIGGPDDRQSEYLQMLSMLTRAIKDVEFRKKLLKVSNAQEVVDLFTNSL